MAQQYKPRRRSARDEGLLPPRRRINGKPIAIIAALLIVAAAAFGLSQCVQCSLPELPSLPAPTTQGSSEASSSSAQQSEQQGSSVAVPQASETSSSKDDGEKSSEKSSKSKSKNNAKSLSDVEESQQKATDYEDAKLPESEGDGTDSAGSGASGGSGNSDGGNGGSGEGGTSNSGSGGSSNGGGSSSSSSSSNSSGSDGDNSGKSSGSSSKLQTYYSKLDAQSDRLTSFVENTYNTDLYKSLKTRKADYEKFKKLRDSILSKLTDSDGNWLVEDYKASGSKKKKAKKNLNTASDLLYERLQIIENAYEAITSLDKDATKKQIQKASDKACKNSQSTYESFEKHMSAAGNVL